MNKISYPSQELLFNMLMLVECVRISGEHLLPHLPSIEAVLERSLLMASKEGQGLATSLLRFEYSLFLTQ